MTVHYNIHEPWKTLDPWQVKVLKCKTNIVLRSGRQVGKSAIISIKVAEHALNNKKQQILVIAKVERQAQLIFSKILAYIHFKNKKMISGGKDKPTKHKLSLKNGTVIHCLPAGDTGYGIMGYTIDMLVADEAAFIPEEVWNSIVPTLTITKGKIILLSTPFLKEGYYYNCFNDPTFTSFHMSAEDCPRKDQAFLDYQKSWMTNEQYAQMYLGEFVTDSKRFFSNKIVNAVCLLKATKYITDQDYFLGVDIARMGRDESAFEGVNGEDRENIFQVSHEVTRKTLTTETTKKIITLNTHWGYNKIGLDDGGVGAGVLDQLFLEDEVKRKVIALNNASRGVDREGHTKKLLKEDMYNSLLSSMERGEIKLLADDEIKASLKSVLYEYPKEEGGKMRIWGSDDHIAEAVIRAHWVAKTKSLKPFIN